MSAVTPARRLVPVALAAGTLALATAGMGLLYRFDPNAADSPFLPCLFQRFTGLYCPGCGITRALHALVHGDLATAWAMNPLLFVLVPALSLLVLLGLGYRPPLPARLQALLLSAKFWIGLLLGFWLLRNLPWWPFAWLAPG